MQQQQQYLNITQQAKYSTIGEFNAQTQQVWIVLHGYGQLSAYFVRKFSVLSDHGYFVIAPEAISKFYLHGHSGRVGASWMTKEDRLKDIENYIQYLNALYDSFNFSNNIKITVVGFSQGAATAARWLANGYVQVDRLLLWSGIFPADLDITSTQTTLASCEIYHIYGVNDPYNKGKQAAQKTIVEQLQFSTKTVRFDGGHDIDTTTLLQFL